MLDLYGEGERPRGSMVSNTKAAMERAMDVWEAILRATARSIALLQAAEMYRTCSESSGNRDGNHFRRPEPAA
jgi:hypothetical protein